MKLNRIIILILFFNSIALLAYGNNIPSQNNTGTATKAKEACPNGFVISDIPDHVVPVNTEKVVIPFTIKPLSSEQSYQDYTTLVQFSDYELVSKENIEILDLTINKQLKLIPQYNKFGSSVITIIATNDYYTDKKSFTLSINYPEIKITNIKPKKSFTGKKIKITTYGDNLNKNVLLISETRTKDTAKRIVVKDNKAYVFASKNRIDIFDVSDIFHPKSLKPIKFDFDLTGFVFHDRHLLLASNEKKLRVYEINLKTRYLKLKTTIDTLDYALDMAVRDNYVFIAAYSKGLQVVDLSNPQKKINIEIPGISCGVALMGDKAYVANRGNGVIVDIKNPLDMKILDNITSNALIAGIFTDKHKLYLADKIKGLVIFDIDNNYYPKLNREISINGVLSDIFVKNDIAFTANLEKGLQILPLSDKFIYPGDYQIICFNPQYEDTISFTVQEAFRLSEITPKTWEVGKEIYATIKGRGFDKNTNISFLSGNMPTPDIVNITDTEIDIHIPALRIPGDYQIRISNSLQKETISFHIKFPFVFSIIPDQFISANISTAKIPFHITRCNEEIDLKSCTFSVHSSNQKLISDKNIQLTGLAEIKTLCLKPSQDQFGTSTITIINDNFDIKTSFQVSVNFKKIVIKSITPDKWDLEKEMEFKIKGLGFDRYTQISLLSEILSPLNIVNLKDTELDIHAPAISYPGRYQIKVKNFQYEDIVSFDIKNPFIISNIPGRNIPENIISVTIPFTITPTCQDALIDDYTIHVHSSNQTLIPDRNIRLDGLSTKNSLHIQLSEGQTGSTSIILTLTNGIIHISESFMVYKNKETETIPYETRKTKNTQIPASNYIFNMKIASIFPKSGILGRNLKTTITGRKLSHVQMYKLPDPDHPFLWEIDIPGEAYDTSIADNYLCVADRVRQDYYLFSSNNSDRIFIIDIKNPMNPTILGSFYTNTSIICLSTTLNTMFITTGDNGQEQIQIVDITNPLIPEITAVIDRLDFDNTIIEHGQKRYIIDNINNTNVLKILHISNPENPILSGSISIPGHSKDIDIKNGFAYIASGNEGLQIVDVKDPQKPLLIGHCKLPDKAEGLIVFDQTIYVTNGKNGFFIIEISDPYHPIYKSFCHTHMKARDIIAAGNKAFIDNYDSNQKTILDIRDIYHPVIIANTSIDCNKTSQVSNNHINISPGFQSVQFGNHSDKRLIHSVRFNKKIKVKDIETKDNTAFLSCGKSGVKAILFPHELEPLESSDEMISFVLPSPGFPGNCQVKLLNSISDDSANVSFETPVTLSKISNQTIYPGVEYASFPFDLKIKHPDVKQSDLIIEGFSGIQALIPDVNIQIQERGEDRNVLIKLLKYCYGSIPIHISASYEHASIIQTFLLTVKFPQITYLLDSSDTLLNINQPYRPKVDSYGRNYSIDASNHCIIQSDSNGIVLNKWGGYGSHAAFFKTPADIAIDSNDLIYIADSGNHRVQVFTPYGQYITLFGEYGVTPGKFISPEKLYIDHEDLIYVKDSGHIHYQTFQKVNFTEGKTKAIIVAGCLKDDYLEKAIKACADFAYRTLINQGLNKDDICYLTSLSEDLKRTSDRHNMIDLYATTENIQRTIIDYTTKETGSLLIYLVDHGIRDAFIINDKEMLLAKQLNEWLNKAQEIIPGRVIVIYDACHSGSFLKPLSDLSRTRQRIVITSSKPSEKAHFNARGAVSFSSHFWSAIFNGHDILSAFNSARNDIISKNQTPLLDANNDAEPNTIKDMMKVKNVIIGNGEFINSGIPFIKTLQTSPENKIIQGMSVEIRVSDIYSQKGIARVWAIITPPISMEDSKIIDLPSLELYYHSQKQGYTGISQSLEIEGNYRIAAYVQDKKGVVSRPKIKTIEVNNPKKRIAFIVCGLSVNDEVDSMGKSAYRALKFQEYTDKNIHYWNSNYPNGADGKPDMNSIEQAFREIHSYQLYELIIYMAGRGDRTNFYLNHHEKISTSLFKQWLKSINETVVVIYDAPFSWHFLNSLKSNHKKRILISGSGANQPTYFLQGGTISFSKYFWDKILDSKSILNAQKFSRTALNFISDDDIPLQTPCVIMGKELAENYYIGKKNIPGYYVPVINSVSPEKILYDDSVSEITATISTYQNNIQHVWAIIQPPDNSPKNIDQPITDLPVTELRYDNISKQYKGTYTEFKEKGVYTIGIYAVDKEGNYSIPIKTRFSKIIK